MSTKRVVRETQKSAKCFLSGILELWPLGKSGAQVTASYMYVPSADREMYRHAWPDL